MGGWDAAVFKLGRKHSNGRCDWGVDGRADDGWGNGYGACTQPHTQPSVAAHEEWRSEAALQIYGPVIGPTAPPPQFWPPYSVPAPYMPNLSNILSRVFLDICLEEGKPRGPWSPGTV